MVVSNKTRKLLWGRSGNMCAFCQKELVLPSTKHNDEVIIGDECHIVSRKAKGPRWDPDFPINELDRHDNLILLCKIHHKVIDDQPESYPAIALKRLKERHEKWVRQNLIKKGEKQGKSNLEKVKLIRSGKEIFSIVIGAEFFDFDYDEPQSKEDVEMISYFIQQVQDYGDFGEDLDLGARVQVADELTNLIKGIENAGFFIFGNRVKRKLKVSGKTSLWDFAVIRILDKDNPSLSSIRKPNA